MESLPFDEESFPCFASQAFFVSLIFLRYLELLFVSYSGSLHFLGIEGFLLLAERLPHLTNNFGQLAHFFVFVERILPDLGNDLRSEEKVGTLWELWGWICCGHDGGEGAEDGALFADGNILNE